MEAAFAGLGIVPSKVAVQEGIYGVEESQQAADSKRAFVSFTSLEDLSNAAVILDKAKCSNGKPFERDIRVNAHTFNQKTSIHIRNLP